MYAKMMGGAAQPPRAMGGGAVGAAAASAAGLGPNSISPTASFERSPDSGLKQYDLDPGDGSEEMQAMGTSVGAATLVPYLTDLVKQLSEENQVLKSMIDIPAQSAAQPGDEVPFDAPADMTRQGSIYESMLGGGQ